MVVVHDDDLPAPRPGRVLTVRGDGLWVEVVCETADEHWSLGLEAFGLRVERPDDAWGERIAVGYDLEFEATDPPGPSQAGVVHGELLVGRDRVSVESPGHLERS
jgi:hypothetical protein